MSIRPTFLSKRQRFRTSTAQSESKNFTEKISNISIFNNRPIISRVLLLLVLLLKKKIEKQINGPQVYRIKKAKKRLVERK